MYLFRDNPIFQHVSDRSPVPVQSSILLVWLTERQQVVRCVDPDGQAVVVYLTKESCSGRYRTQQPINKLEHIQLFSNGVFLLCEFHMS